MSNIPTVAAFIAAWGKQDIEEIMGFFAENAIYHNIPLDPVQGIEAVRQYYSFCLHLPLSQLIIRYV